MRLRARRCAIRRISGTSDEEERLLAVSTFVFFGGHLVGLALDRGHHGEGEHDQRDVAMPAVPGSSFVMVETEHVLGVSKLSYPDQGLDRGSCVRAGC